MDTHPATVNKSHASRARAHTRRCARVWGTATTGKPRLCWRASGVEPCSSRSNANRILARSRRCRRTNLCTQTPKHTVQQQQQHGVSPTNQPHAEHCQAYRSRAAFSMAYARWLNRYRLGTRMNTDNRSSAIPTGFTNTIQAKKDAVMMPEPSKPCKYLQCGQHDELHRTLCQGLRLSCTHCNGDILGSV